MMPVSELRLDPLVPVPDHVVVQHVYEPVHRDAREAPLVEELLLETAEEPLRGRVVRRTAFCAHRTRQVVVPADADPFRPPVVAAAITVDDWFLPVPERGARVGGHAVGQCRVRAGADRPRDRKPVVAVDHGRQAGLARGNRELREVRDPQHVRTLGVEVAVHQIRRRLGQLTLVRAVPLRAPEQGRQAMPGRQPHDPFRRYPDAHALQLQMDPLVPVPALAVLERLLDQGQQPRVLVRSVHGLDLVVVCAARDADHGQQAPGRHAQRLANGLDEERLLSVGRAFPGLRPALFPTAPTRLSGSRSRCRAPSSPAAAARCRRPTRPDGPASPPASFPATPPRPPDRPRPSGRRRVRTRGPRADPSVPGLSLAFLRHVRLLGFGEHLSFPVSHDGCLHARFGGRLA